MKLAVIFPGQGSQYIGMGKDLYTNYPAAREVFQEADEVLAFPLSKLIFEGPEEELNKTVNTQPAILTASIACWRVLALEEGFSIKPVAAAGHSLGEFSALVAVGALSFADAVALVRKRGQLMQEAAPLGTAGMAVILGLENEKVVEVCREASAVGVVEPANFNCPGQIVISGSKPALEKAMELAKAAGAKRAIALAVSGPFHSSLMKPAAEGLALELAKITVKDPQVPVMANAIAEYLRDQAGIRENLIKQVSCSVRWEESIRAMAASGITSFVEIGPGKVLSGLVKKITKEVLILNVEDKASLEKTLANLKEVG